MMDNSQKINQIMKLIEYGEYFTINRPRQYGKTTTLHFLTERLEQAADYLPIALNFQGIDSMWHESDRAFAQMFANEIINALQYDAPSLASFLKTLQPSVEDMNALSEFVTELVKKETRKIVLLIDEVDASSNYEPFLSFLGMLRTKYLARMKPQHATFHSIVLAGVHDIKSLKYKLRDPETAQFNSPCWNIAVDFTVEMAFNPVEIAPMLAEYSAAESVNMDVPAMAERLYYHTSGYPFLVSRICKIIAEDMLTTRAEQNWTLDDIDEAVRRLLKENNTNFDSLIKNLENNDDLYNIVSRVILDGEVIPFNQYNPVIYTGILYGVFKRNGQVKIHNRLYEQLIYDYMTSKMLTGIKHGFNFGGHFVSDENGIDMEAVLLRFQQFMKEQYSKKNKDFIEHHGRMLFMAFLSPILNGEGYCFREVETSEEKRLDMIVTFRRFRYVIEMKLWYGEVYHQRGLRQLSQYLDIHALDKGYLLIFDDRKDKTWEARTIAHEGKEIFAVWV